MTLIGGLVGVWYRLVLRIEKVAGDLYEYKLQVTKEYASIGYLKDVEERLIKAIDRLTDQSEKSRKDTSDRLDRVLSELRDQNGRSS